MTDYSVLQFDIYMHHVIVVKAAGLVRQKVSVAFGGDYAQSDPKLCKPT